MLFAAALVFTGCSNGSGSGSGGTPEPEPPPTPKYAVNFSVDGANGTLKAAVGGTEISSGDEVEQGKTIEFTATPDSGYRVKGWTLDGAAVNGTNNSYTLSVTKAVNVQVSFENTPPTLYTVNFSVDGANGALGAKVDGTEISSGNQVQKGKTVTFTAVPEAGYEVKEWQIFGTGAMFETGTGTAGNNTAKVNLKDDLTVKVSFKIQTVTPKHKVTMSAGANGGISAAPALPADGMVNEDSTITFTASPNDGYTVDTWTVTGGQVLTGGQAGSSTAMVEITEPVTVAVSFKIRPPTTYTVSFGVAGTPPNGTISATYKEGGAAFNSGTAVGENTVLVFTASPAEGYKVEKWTVNGATVEGNITNTYEHTVTQPAMILVSFVSSVTIPDNFTLPNGAEYKVTDKAQKQVIMTKRENDFSGTVYTVNVTVEYSGITYTLTGFSGSCITKFGELIPSLEAFALSSESSFLSVDGGILFDKVKTKLIRYPNGKTGTSYRVPDGVRVLGEYSFYNSDNLTSLILPTGLTTVKDSALYYCPNLQTINLPSTLTSIGLRFLGYSKVEDVKIPEGITDLSRDFLYRCNRLKTVEVPSTLSTTNWSFCYECTALETVTCKRATPPALGDYAFTNVTLSDVTLKVPAGSVSNYQSAPYWKDFKKPFVALP